MISSPCTQPSYLTIDSAPLPDGLSYILFDQTYGFIHDNFVISAEPEVISLCGSLTYSTIFDGSFISYTASEQKFEIYSEDISLIGSQEITIYASLEDHPSVVSVSEKTEIEFIDPCLDPFSL